MAFSPTQDFKEFIGQKKLANYTTTASSTADTSAATNTTAAASSVVVSFIKEVFDKFGTKDLVRI